MIYSYLEGRLGNILFEIAAGASLAKKMNVPFKALTCYPDILPDNNTIPEYVKAYQKSILRKIDFLDENPKNPKVSEEPSFDYQPLPFEKDILLKGFFQSEKYFDEEYVRDLFGMDAETAFYIQQKYGHLLKLNPVSVQLRRGDYLNIQYKHPVCQMSYYRKAMSAFAPDTFFIILSDDIDWCKKHFKGKQFFFVEEESPLIDLYLQSLCKHNIISNSSFGWWGAWLNTNPQKRVIYPTPWFSPRIKLNTKDLCPETWEKKPIARLAELYFWTYYSLIKCKLKNRIYLLSRLWRI